MGGGGKNNVGKGKNNIGKDKNNIGGGKNNVGKGRNNIGKCKNNIGGGGKNKNIGGSDFANKKVFKKLAFKSVLLFALILLFISAFFNSVLNLLFIFFAIVLSITACKPYIASTLFKMGNAFILKLWAH